MTGHSMRGLHLMLAASATVLVVSVIWALSPSEANAPTVSLGPDTLTADALAEADDQSMPLPDFPDMELWTKPPPIVTPPAPPTALRLNAELLAVRLGENDSDAIATLYLVDKGEIVRLKRGDQIDGMTVELVSASIVRLRRGEQTLTLTRDSD